MQTNTVQLVDALASGTYQDIRAALPGIKLVQVVHVTNEAAVDEAQRVGEYVDAVLLDLGNPTRAVKELGGTGRVHNWHLSRQIREQLDIPIFLAGGLHAGNAREAIKTIGKISGAFATRSFETKS